VNECLHASPDGFGVAAEHGVLPLVEDGAVVEDVEQLVGVGRDAHLGDEDLHLHRLHLVGEDLPEDLGVVVGQAAGVDVVAAVLEALQIRGTNAGHAQLVELVVLAHTCEREPVVDLADLAQRAAGVLGDQCDAVVVADRHQRSPASDALARIVGAVLHHLFGRDVERLAHRPLTSLAMDSNTATSSSSARRCQPSAVMVATTG
jgi:hypothetical protein